MALSRITAASIADGTVVAADIADGAVTGPKLGATSINANNIVDSSITSAKIDTIANTQLTGTITTAQLGTGAVSNTKIASGAVEQYFADTGYEVQFRNRIINGDMRIDQRNAGASVTLTTSAYTLDRWFSYATESSKFSIQQNAGSVTPPTSFTNYIGATSLSAYSITSGDFFSIMQRIEGYSVSDLAWGTANAKTVTLSFWVRSSLTGTFGGSFRNSAGNRSYPFTYTISVADTWEYKTVTIAGDTSGTWLTTNGIGLDVLFSLGTGSTYLGTAGAWAGANYLGATGQVDMVATNAATFYITGVQLEVGSVATPFERRPFGTELSLCQRYFEKSYRQATAVGASAANGYATSPVGSNTVSIQQVYASQKFSVNKRASPTVTIYGFLGATGQVSNANSGVDLGANTGSVNSVDEAIFSVWNNSGGTFTTQLFAIIYHWTASSEL